MRKGKKLRCVTQQWAETGAMECPCSTPALNISINRCNRKPIRTQPPMCVGGVVETNKVGIRCKRVTDNRYPPEKVSKWCKTVGLNDFLDTKKPPHKDEKKTVKNSKIMVKNSLNAYADPQPCTTGTRIGSYFFRRSDKRFLLDRYKRTQWISINVLHDCSRHITCI